MSGPRASALRCVWATALLVACSSTSGKMPGAAAADEPTVVRFSYDAVKPPTVSIRSDGHLKWVNTAPDTTAVVVFPAAMASQFRCADLGPYFSKSQDVYRSLPLAGSDVEIDAATVDLPCALDPGSYDYQIWFMGTGFGMEGTNAQPEQILRAKIIVQ